MYKFVRFLLFFSLFYGSNVMSMRRFSNKNYVQLGNNIQEMLKKWIQNSPAREYFPGLEHESRLAGIKAQYDLNPKIKELKKLPKIMPSVLKPKILTRDYQPVSSFSLEEFNAKVKRDILAYQARKIMDQAEAFTEQE